MKRLYIIGEGATEEEFVNKILRPYFSKFGFHDVRCILISTSKGHRNHPKKMPTLQSMSSPNYEL